MDIWVVHSLGLLDYNPALPLLLQCDVRVCSPYGSLVAIKKRLSVGNSHYFASNSVAS